ncbi:glycosyltransferase family 4 protein [Pedobacter hartonius]|uniref:Glycosyltransferase involved in cell wall bisynthesis n=1 Tax=Pedobacter hartonius TaxID=425514 RepID=A0A1H4GKR9_9SPHI|nr:glycosyltransferase family 4 protein [Pedobacter hartonius]SEB09901.1 Glycosyltransferase involved in cell wall bisynthesis [Pedobacter hartonius]
MKIGIIAHLKHPIKSPFRGGLEAFTYDICKRLIARGHEVMLFASSKSDATLNVYPILSDEAYNDLSGHREKKPNLSSEYMAEHYAYMELMQHIDTMNFDVIFNNSLHYVPITMAGMLKLPMLTVLHTPPFFELQNAVRLERRQSTITYISVSARNAENWKQYTDECTVIQNGIDLNSWTYYPDPTGGYAIWFGRIHPDKGTHFAIQAANIAGMPLKIAGGIADEKYFRTQVEPLLGGGVEYVGRKDHTELNALIGNAVVSLVTPTWEEPFGLVIAESLACGTPIAGFDIGALPQLVAQETGVLAKPGDIEGLAGAITGAALKNRLSCREHAEKSFDVEKMVNQYEDQLQLLTGVFQ